MAALDPVVQPALEEALFDAPVLAGADSHAPLSVSLLTSSSVAELVAADADDADAIHALRCALAAPMRLTRRAAAQRVLLLQMLAHRLLVTHSGAAFVRCDSAALVAVVGASAATSRRVVPRDVADEACVLLRLALAERQPTNVPTAERTTDPSIDTLCLAAARRNAFADVVPDLELELANSPCDSHTQLQFALALAAGGFAARAVERLRQWVDQFRGNGDAAAPVDMVSVHLLVTKLLLNDLGAVVEANAEARVALQHAEQQQPHNKEAIASAALAVGVTSAARARLEHGGSRRQRLQADARTMLRRAARLNPVSSDVSFALALAHADVRAIEPALELARAAVSMRGDAASWNLLALLLSSRRRYKRALAATKAGLKLGDDIELLRTQAQLQHALNDTPGAMRSLMRAFATFRSQRALLNDQEQPRQSRGARTMSGSEPSVLSARTFDETLDRRTSDVRSNGGAARSQTARSVVGSPITPADVRSQGAAAALAIGAATGAAGAENGERPSVGFGNLDLWLDVGKLFCAAEQFEEAHSCLVEMRKLMPLEADVLAFEASLAHARGRVDEADQLCEKLLSLYPTHTEALQLSGALLLEREQASRVVAATGGAAASNNSARLLLAEQRLQQAVRQDPLAHEAWLALGRVLLAKGENERAAECFFTQIELENTAPVRAFGSAVQLLL